MIPRDGKLSLLEAIYRLFDDFLALHPVACTSGCSTCCTGDVTLTTLEGMALVRHLESSGRSHLTQRVVAARDQAGLRPAVTINRLAELCAADQEPPGEFSPAAGGDCPLLSDSRCPVYAMRPLACRAMLSRSLCLPDCGAELDPLLLSAGSVVLQHVEHLDAGGLTGNLTDILALLADEQGRRAWDEGQLGRTPAGLAINRRLRVLMVPPEHRAALQPLVDALRRLFTLVA
jgi:Fe-S-cluster containining protein